MRLFLAFFRGSPWIRFFVLVLNSCVLFSMFQFIAIVISFWYSSSAHLWPEGEPHQVCSCVSFCHNLVAFDSLFPCFHIHDKDKFRLIPIFPVWDLNSATSPRKMALWALIGVFITLGIIVSRPFSLGRARNTFFFFFFWIYVYFFIFGCAGVFTAACRLFAVVHRLLIVVAPLVVEHGL